MVLPGGPPAYGFPNGRSSGRQDVERGPGLAGRAGEGLPWGNRLPFFPPPERLQPGRRKPPTRPSVPRDASPSAPASRAGPLSPAGEVTVALEGAKLGKRLRAPRSVARVADTSGGAQCVGARRDVSARIPAAVVCSCSRLDCPASARPLIWLSALLQGREPVGNLLATVRCLLTVI